MRMATIFVIVCASSGARANTDAFLGWSADHTFYAYATHTCAQTITTVCPVEGKHATWPAAFGSGGECVDSDSNEAITEDAVRKLVVAGGAGPAAAKISVANKTVRRPEGSVVVAVVTVKAGAKSGSANVDDAPDAKVGSVTWRADRRAVAVNVRTSRPSGCGGPASESVAVLEVDLGLDKDRAGATAANVRGMGAIKKLDYAGARTAFEAAIKADDTFVWPHYNLASLASITGDLATVKTQLLWLSSSKDTDAKTALKKAAAGDPDLDFASTEPDIRTLLKLPEYPLGNLARLTERNGVWSAEANGCDNPAVTVKATVKKTITVTAYPCNAKPIVKQLSFGMPMESPTFYFGNKIPGLGDQPELGWTKCPGSSLDGSCWEIDGRVFHRGVLHVAPK